MLRVVLNCLVEVLVPRVCILSIIRKHSLGLSPVIQIHEGGRLPEKEEFAKLHYRTPI